MHRSYVPKDWLDAFLVDPNRPLPKEVVVRFFSVLRIKSDEEIAVFDGYGREIRGILSSSAGNKTFLRFSLQKKSRPIPEIILLQASLDDAKITETIKRGCEFGVDKFIIFDAERSDKFCFLKIAKKLNRYERLMQDASRQSGRFFIPEIHMWQKFEKILNTFDSSNDFGVFGDVNEQNLLSKILSKDALKKQNFFIAVGPEGGLSDDECAMLKKAGFKGALWAPFTLRSELAALAAVAIVNSFCGRA